MVNDSTREYSVYISDKNNTVNGSGLLFYSGGDTVFVFTCAHVIDNSEEIRLHILKAINAANDEYDTFCIDVPISQVVYSPFDKVEEIEDVKTHSEDLAVIWFDKPIDMEISLTEYIVTETFRNMDVLVQGYPNGVPAGEDIIEYLDCLHGKVIINQPNKNKFAFRLDDTFIDSGSRIYELKGLSGAPVWYDKNEVNGVLGLLTNAYDQTATLAKVRATKAHRLRFIMKDRFNIAIERKLEIIPDEEVAGVGVASFSANEIQLSTVQKTENEKWIMEQLIALRSVIDDMKLQKAIDMGESLVEDPRYPTLSMELQLKVKKYLLYCYEIADMDTEFDDLEDTMCAEGLIEGHDTLRMFTRTFMKREYDKTVQVTQQYIDNFNGTESDNLLSFAKNYNLLAKAYTENLPIEETIGKLVDTDENIIYPTNDIENDSLIYQMIGYVYGDIYNNAAKAVRFLNRSYRIGFDSMVLESLAAAYYKLGVSEASDETGVISNVRLIDQKALYKARECCLIIRAKADELFWAGTMRRIGLCIYNTFVFLNDTYRIITLYGDVKKYMPDLTDDELRDIEMKAARASVHKGEINLCDYPHINDTDRMSLETLSIAFRCSNLIENAAANNSANLKINTLQFIDEISQMLSYLENNVEYVEESDRIQIYIHLINIYGRSILLWGWDVKDRINALYEQICKYAEPDLVESLGNFVFELNAPIEEAVKRFKETYSKRKDIISWQELNHFYIRHDMFEEADEMYKNLLFKQKELFGDAPEFAYRAFIDYIMTYKRDLKNALQYYIDAKSAFKDADISGFLELELMFCSGSFNESERFDIERKKFVEMGLIDDEHFHRTAFIAYLVNLNIEEAEKHYNYIIQCPHRIVPQQSMYFAGREEIYFLSLKNVIQPNFTAALDSMRPERADEARRKYQNESWHIEINKQIQNQFCINKSVVIDAWGLYQLMVTTKLEILDEFDNVYISHMSITRLLDEMSKTNSDIIRSGLYVLKDHRKVRFHSADFKAQIEVRNVTNYLESAAAVAVGVDKDCLVILGEPKLDDALLEYYGSRIVRVNEINLLLD